MPHIQVQNYRNRVMPLRYTNHTKHTVFDLFNVYSNHPKSQRAVENREKRRKLVAKSYVVPQRPSRLRDR